MQLEDQRSRLPWNPKLPTVGNLGENYNNAGGRVFQGSTEDRDGATIEETQNGYGIFDEEEESNDQDAEEEDGNRSEGAGGTWFEDEIECDYQHCR